MYFHHNKKKATKININIDSRNIPQLESAKFLGITLDYGLNWKKHIENLLRKIKSNLKILQENRRLVTKHVLKILYYSQIYSHLSYRISVWGNSIPNTTIRQLQKLLNKAVQMIAGKKHITTKDYSKLRILRVKQIITLENLKFTYKLNNNLLPNKIKECSLHDHKGTLLKKKHRYNTRHKSLPNAPKAQSQHYLNSIFCASIREFQTLKGETRKIPVFSKFVSECKNVIMKGQN